MSYTTGDLKQSQLKSKMINLYLSSTTKLYLMLSNISDELKMSGKFCEDCSPLCPQ